MSHCRTRWLSFLPAVENVIAQWLELKAHFLIVRLSEKLCAADLLFEMYSNDKSLHFYFVATNPSTRAENE